ncbi:AbiH family protein [Flavobacterium aurantiibacter]|uniref:Bacteriophage abortive infection AbiH n=1 Tax=Flavobacterium aurantiibacter TaxID=2023067 RepID=A0A255ZTT7_9FLAO|nr:AbiH family protein [Flavobacterium aurantiibacter]OYQ44809.1 hypothetical protein CHX27_07310 [Flavobacterium aurantiibacter]
MNRIILIGNGFDLAHGMKTRYSDFIADYWNNVINEVVNRIKTNYTSIPGRFENEEIIINNLPGQYIGDVHFQAANFEELKQNLKQIESGIKFKNQFLQLLTIKHNELSWVDIEVEYYTLLKNSFKNSPTKYSIKDLNNDFRSVKILLENYLIKIENEFKESFESKSSYRKIKNAIGFQIYAPLSYRDIDEASLAEKAKFEFESLQNDLSDISQGFKKLENLNSKRQYLIKRLRENANINDIRKLLVAGDTINYFDLNPNEILFLNFNYTLTEEIYRYSTEFETYESLRDIVRKVIHIHGTTDKYDKNDVIFGFGDELDKDYREIEDLHDNDYLENVKSIKYMETDNFKELLQFINSDKYQIFIMGHSCGVSDRTLLNTLFEHKNCASIKPFYYKIDDESDNYSDLVRNISRNFNSKALMRDKVVNKKYCTPLK